MKNKYSVINKFYPVGYLSEPVCDGLIYAGIFVIEFNIPLDFVKRLIIKRYQSGEVNNMKYADSVAINNTDFICNYQKNKVMFTTSDLGYGKNLKPVTYYVQVIPEIYSKTDDRCFAECTDIVCITTPGEIGFNV